MVDWVIKNDPLHLSCWYCIEKGYTEKEWDTMHVCPEFFPYYEQALKIIGVKYLDKRSNVRDSIAHRWHRVYFGDLRKTEDEKIKIDAEIRAKALVKETEALSFKDDYKDKGTMDK
jgi:hypothetical protein